MSRLDVKPSNVAIIYRPSPNCLSIARRVLDYLRNKGINTKSYWVDDVLKNIIGYVDLVIPIGGDGTLLKVSRLFQEYSPLIFPIPCGRRTVFYEYIDTGRIEEYIERILNGEYFIEVLDRISIEYNGKRLKALNEIALISRDRGRLVKYSIDITSQSTRSSFEVEADGILIGSSSGSSAYNLSACGSLITNELHAVFLTVLNPMELNIKPIILPLLSKIKIKSNGYVDLYVDGELKDLLGPDREVSAELDHIGFRIIRFSGKRNYVREVFDKRKIVFK